MPIKRTAYKELRKSKLRHFKKISTASELKTMAKRFDHLVSEKKTDEARTLLKTLVSKMDKAAQKGIIHRNAASRKISRLTRKVARSSAKA